MSDRKPPKESPSKPPRNPKVAVFKDFEPTRNPKVPVRKLPKDSKK